MLTRHGLLTTVDSAAAAASVPAAPELVIEGTRCGRSRKEMLAERRSNDIKAANHWKQLQEKQFADRRSARLALTFKVDVGAAAAKSGSSEDTGSSRGGTPRDGPSTGVRRVEGRSGAECQTYFKSSCSKRTFPLTKNRSKKDAFICVERPLSARAPSVGIAGGHGGNRSTADGQQRRRPQSARRGEDITGKVSCEGRQGAPQPSFLCSKKIFIPRPEITTLDSYDVPIYSCFSRDHKFHPMFDDVMAARRDRTQHQKEEHLRQLANQSKHHVEVVVKEYRTEQQNLEDDRRAARPFVTPRATVRDEQHIETAYHPQKVLEEQQQLQKPVPLPPPPRSSVTINRKSVTTAPAESTPASTPQQPPPASVFPTQQVPSPASDRRESTPSSLQQRYRSSSLTKSATPPLSDTPPNAKEEPGYTLSPRVPVTSGVAGAEHGGAFHQHEEHRKFSSIPKPPTSVLKRRPHTAGASRFLQHAVGPRNVSDVNPEVAAVVTPGEVPVQGVAGTKQNVPRPPPATTPNGAAGGQSSPRGGTPVRPHSARPITSASIAVDFGGIGITGSAPLIALLKSAEQPCRQAAPRSNTSTAIDDAMKNYRPRPQSAGATSLMTQG